MLWQQAYQLRSLSNYRVTVGGKDYLSLQGKGYMAKGVKVYNSIPIRLQALTP